jgi:Ca2+-binding RTX toxin-like protein
VFNTALSTTGVDTITDFSHTQGDLILLDNAVMTALGGTPGTLGTQFYTHAGATNGADSNDHIVYNTTTGALYYDSNGSTAGGTTEIAIIGTSTTHPTLVAADFGIV